MVGGETARPKGERLRTAAALSAIALGVALAGAFLLPRLGADVPQRPLDPAPRLIDVRGPADDGRCRIEPKRRGHA